MRCIECEEIELARVRDQRPTQTLPIPYQAMDGFPAGRTPSHLTRRRLMQWGAAGAASIYAAKELGWEQIWESVAAAADAPEKKCVVMLYLAGGNDGLNIVLPSGGADYSAYVDARPFIHRGQGANAADGRVGSWQMPGPAGAALAFANVTVSGADNNGGTAGFDTLFGDGTGGPGSDLAVLPAVDAKKYTLSHFDNSDLWFEASADLNNKTGWLGRWIDRNGDANNPLQAVSLDTALSKAIRTQTMPVSAINSLPMTGFKPASSLPPSGSNNTPNWNAEIDKLTQVPVGAGNDYLARSRSTYGLTYKTSLLAGGAYAPPAGSYPTTTPTGTTLTTLSKRLQMAAHMIDVLGTQIITIHWGGFDTHTSQLINQDKQFKELSRALAAFQADLKTRLIDHRVMTLVFSEFGRRVKETPDSSVGANDAGTDHGAGGLMFALGTKVKGGFAADWPGCIPSKLVPPSPPNNPNQGNLQVPTDYRSVYMAVLRDWLGGIDPESLIDGGAIDPLHRGDGQTGLFKA
ncbi:DUF1501 domain-containing protein [Solirubrobacter ginsenosidimutans]|uniref:DUF1501 domain-containing protein n=1 Tax=Solirubrobacter ginsenosidimutans TaxID=490573 RepID=A0A9X3MVN2_9ACTN|nr:DUF1501 domain-containing protein [Solirubrobacter ginsenosidimutans]MDA0162080.1 DUF1501 domain-containing protein [Solirubrobacter ginsenosidimutans]